MESLEKIRVGVIGTSWWADGMHLPALASHTGAVAAAICGRDRTRAEQMAAKHGVKQVFSDWQTMIDEAALDAIIICAPDELHHPIAMAALEAGLHVLCEKPLASNAALGREMHLKARDGGLVNMTYFTFRWIKQSIQMKRLIDDGFVGRIQHAAFAFLAGGGRGTWKENWRYDQRHGNGALGDLGAHMIDMARWMCGEISSVSANLSALTTPPSGCDVPVANDSAILAVNFSSLDGRVADGAHGTIRASNVELVKQNGFELHADICGDAGKLELCVDLSGATLRGIRNGEEELRDLPIPDEIAQGVDFTRGIVDQKRFIFSRHSAGVRLFIDSIITSRSSSPTASRCVPDFYDGWMAQVIIDAALESDVTGKRVLIG